MGIRIVLDNFGNGCSSISHLKKAPIQKIKINPVFIHALGTGNEDADVAGAIIAMTKNLRLKVSASGVETDNQALLLKKSAAMNIRDIWSARPCMPVKSATSVRRTDRAI